jgi:hypothetical protein
MSGAHRRTGGNSVTSALKSARWLAALLVAAIMTVALLALLAAFIYIPITHPAAVPLMMLAALSIYWVGAARDLALIFRRASARSSRDLLDRIASAGWLLGATVTLLGVISQQEGWLHGEVGELMAWINCALLLTFAAYYLGGKRRLATALADRAATRQRHG